MRMRRGLCRRRLPRLRSRVLIVGAGWAGRELAKVLTQETTDYHLLGFVDDDPLKQRAELEGLPIPGKGVALLDIVQAHQVGWVIVAITHNRLG